MKRIMPNRVVVWWKGIQARMASPSTSKALNTFAGDHSYQIIKSPSLVSLDLLANDWLSNSTHWDPPPSIGIPSNKQTAAIINGKSIAEEIRSGIASEVCRMKESIGKVPGLAVILVGQRRDSETYVRNKVIACEEVGIKSLMTKLPDNCTEDEVLNAVSSLNDNPSVHGILVQLPLPQHLDEGKILSVLSLEKDVDGFHPLNMGNLARMGREPLFTPCTPKGCIELLLRSGVKIMGKKAVVIGRSNIAGLPASLLLQRHHATVSVVHALTENPEQITREADIVVTAVGVPNLVRGNWLKPGSVVIDVGTSPVEDPRSEHGYRLMGDVCFEEAVRVVSAITPVPGGVGPMTIAMLLSNTLDSAKWAYRFT
ncbi:bifunctional protein FolD 1, mitochondrial [Malania oleifera]|uniref:bifunctional protein FolD 1, mitochondrial n=1 Tax=Malania oleifera TaxID=397392 RepID=UPI0025AE9FF6|nr:bifunctional protein FolD 1, mitochondrial [Malania oleifera]XP_057972039.1 bifunctional protein FolD 1, mitochondrial [Malania oleifera]